MKIEQINGFSIGNVVRLKDGDGRPHTIRSFTLDGIRITNWFCVVHFEDGTETMLDNIEIFQQPSLPEGLESDATMLENILGTYKTLEDMLDLSTGQDQDILESMNFEREWLKKRLSQKMPEDLEKAAEKIIRDKYPMLHYSSLLTKREMVELIKAGAEWMAGQGVTVEGIVCTDLQMIDVPDHSLDRFDNSEEVIVQIRKK